jgi:DnaK suppressor protein
MMENSDQIRTKLLARQAELKEEIKLYREDALQSGVAEVQDEIDQVISSEAKTASMGLSSRQFLSLQNVQAALERLDNGTYGKCVVCGRPIEPARLRAIPETPYCIEHAEQAETTTEDDGLALGGSAE